MNQNNYVSSRERERESNKLVWIILGIIALGGIGGGIYYLVKQNSETKESQTITVEKIETQMRELEQILEKPEHASKLTLKGKFLIIKAAFKDKKNTLSQEELKDLEKELKKMKKELADSPTPPQPDQKEKQAKRKLLGKYQLYFYEPELNSLLPQIPYIGANYSSSTLEEIADRNLEIVRLKRDKLFTQYPTTTQEFKDKYENAGKDKIIFLYISLIPRKSDGKADWIKWQEQEEKEEKLFKFNEIKNFLQNKTNPALKDWYNNLKSDPDPVKRLDLIDRQINAHLNIYKVGWWLHRIGKEKGWVVKEYFKEILKPGFKDTTGTQIKINFPLVTEYDLSKWNDA